MSSIVHRLAVLGFLLLSGVPALAQSSNPQILGIQPGPSNPTPNDYVTIVVSGLSLDTCTPKIWQSTRQGSDIRIDLYKPCSYGYPALTPWMETANIGYLPVGNYQVKVTYSGIVIEQKNFSVSWTPTPPPPVGPGPAPLPPGTVAVNDSPQLVYYWEPRSTLYGYNASYWLTYSSPWGVFSTATWQGSVPWSGSFKVYAHIPYPSVPTPRTSQARYTIRDLGNNQTYFSPPINHQVPTSQWAFLGQFPFSGGPVSVTLVDETFEPYQTVLVADAVCWAY